MLWHPSRSSTSNWATSSTPSAKVSMPSALASVVIAGINRVAGAAGAEAELFVDPVDQDRELVSTEPRDQGIG